MNLEPLYENIIVQRIEAQEKSKGGLYIPTQAQEKSQQARIIAVGTGVVQLDGSLRPLSVQPGDIVLLGKYSGTEVKHDEQTYIIIKETDVLAIVKGDSQS